jgi:hypothetical protein
LKNYNAAKHESKKKKAIGNWYFDSEHLIQNLDGSLLGEFVFVGRSGERDPTQSELAEPPLAHRTDDD